MNDTATAAANPFAAPAKTADSVSGSAVARSDSERAIKEVEAAMIIAKRFPRNQMQAMDRILQSCSRESLAHSALYEYPRGGELVTGPSIRLAEAIAQQWGNMQFGIRELSQSIGVSTVEAFAWDVETNTRSTKVFQVQHIRHTRRGVKRLEDPRDIYEMVANQGARRLRACILAVIPGDVVEAAVRQCEVTVKAAIEVTDEVIQALVDAFAELGVSREQLSAYLGHHLTADVVSPGEIMRLRKVYQSIKDGFAGADQYFQQPTQSNDEKPAAGGVQGLKDRVKPKAQESSDQPNEEDGSGLLAQIENAETMDELDRLAPVVEALDKRTAAFKSCAQALDKRRAEIAAAGE